MRNPARRQMGRRDHRWLRRVAGHLQAGSGRCASADCATAPVALRVLAFVSDQDFVALANVSVVIKGGDGVRVDTTSMADGAILADVPDSGDIHAYSVTLSKGGFGAKIAKLTCGGSIPPAQFRLLSDAMTGYMNPKWSRTGESAEYCVHSTKPYTLSLWRCGRVEQEHVKTVGVIDEHGPQAMRQLLPDRDFTQDPEGCNWNRVGFNSVYQSHSVVAPERSGLYYLHARATDGSEETSFPWIVSPAAPTCGVAVLSSTITQCAYNPYGGRSNYVNQDGLGPGTLTSQPVSNVRQQAMRFDMERPHTEDDNEGWWPFETHAAPLSFARPEASAVLPLETRITDAIPGRLNSSECPACCYF